MSSHRPWFMLPLLLVGLALTGCPNRPDSTAPTPAPSPIGSPAPTPAPTNLGFDKTRYEPISPLCQDARVPVLMFHDVIKKRGRGSVYFDCTVKELTDTLDWLTEQGAHFITLEQLHRHLVRGEPVPQGAVVLTFDDNYQGFYDNAYPILKERGIPSAMFVHTDFVGNKKKAKPNMDWETLRKLDGEGLVTIASHTCSHPPDMTKLPLDAQERELTESKAVLERELGHPIPYLAYPVGSGDGETFAAAERAGYTMAFTMVNAPAEESPGILVVNRYIHSKYRKAWEDAVAAAADAPAAIVRQPLTDSPVSLQVGEYDGIKLAMVRGGKPVSVRDLAGARKSVGEFIRDTSGAVAGMNGTFFVNAALKGTDNAMIGPFRAQNEPEFYPDKDPTRLPKLLNRPMVVWSGTQIVLAPFNPSAMNEERALQQLLPDMTDCFLAGAWIVHDGQARTRKELAPYAARDFNDPRKRAFLGIGDAGELVLGASRDVITTEALARGIAAAGIREAVLMDSGFSTSIVFDGKIIATGHTAKDLPSRPVPHAVVLVGTIDPITDPAVKELFDRADPSVGKISAAEAQAQLSAPDRPRHRKRRH